ncbi:MAG: hypothetical protein IIA63_03460 [Nitrospinae bacterium]|nr:hypothetical protein [Nitrospinota bacterium]
MISIEGSTRCLAFWECFPEPAAVEELLEVLRLDVRCRLKAGFFIKAKTDSTKGFVTDDSIPPSNT